MSSDDKNNGPDTAKLDKIKKALGVDTINEDDLDYYYLNRDILCCDIDLVPMFDNIKDFDYLGPIKQLSKYYKDTYYDELLERVKYQKIEAPIYIKDYNYDMDEILMQYIKCIKGSSVLVVWPKALAAAVNTAFQGNIKNTNFYKELEKNGKVHGIKEMNLTRKQVQGLIYQIYYDKDGFKSIKAIKGKQESSNANEYKNKFFIIFYKATKFTEISGKDAPLKNKLREILRNDSNDKESKLNFFLHVSDNHTQVYELSQLFCNKNSMRVLQYQRLDRIFYNDFYKSQVVLMTFKNWLYQRIHPLDHIRFLLLSGITLYTMGMRQASDLDMIIYPYPRENTKTPDLNKLIDHYLMHEKTRLANVEGAMEREDGWYLGDVKHDYMKEWQGTIWPNLYGSKSIAETILNPKFHYYYMGLKMIITKAEIERRKHRARPAAYADLIAMMEILHVDIDFPEFPKGYWSAHEYYEYTPKKINELFKKITFYLRKRYNIKKSPDEIRKIMKK